MLRLILPLAAVIACGFYGTAHADQDLDTLLGELTFGDSSRANAPSTPLLEQTPQADELVPLAPADQQLTNIQDPGSIVEPPSFEPIQDATLAPTSPLPEPVQPQLAGEAPINFNQYFQAGGHGDACAAGNASAPCGTQAICRPHHAPSLPPPSTFLQYFRSDDCYSDVWNGFAAERQKRCEHCHKHIHGTCDCFSKGHGHCTGHCGCGCDRNASACDAASKHR